MIRNLDDTSRHVAGLFASMGWTWRGAETTPTALDIAATFNSLEWDVVSRFHQDGLPHFAATGRLQVTVDEHGIVNASVNVGRGDA